jgi:hypothetical protein
VPSITSQAAVDAGARCGIREERMHSSSATPPPARGRLLTVSRRHVPLRSACVRPDALLDLQRSGSTGKRVRESAPADRAEIRDLEGHASPNRREP